MKVKRKKKKLLNEIEAWAFLEKQFDQPICTSCLGWWRESKYNRNGLCGAIDEMMDKISKATRRNMITRLDEFMVPLRQMGLCGSYLVPLQSRTTTGPEHGFRRVAAAKHMQKLCLAEKLTARPIRK